MLSEWSKAERPIIFIYFYLLAGFLMLLTHIPPPLPQAEGAVSLGRGVAIDCRPIISNMNMEIYYDIQTYYYYS